MLKRIIPLIGLVLISTLAFTQAAYAVTPVTYGGDQILASDGAEFDRYGEAIAVSGNTLVVGSPRTNSAYLYDCSSGTCIEQAKLVASDIVDGDSFGNAVAISGSDIIVGAPNADTDATRSGAAYLFDADCVPVAGVCNETKKLLPATGASNDKFGWSVAIDGPHVVVGMLQSWAPGVAYLFDVTCTPSSGVCRSNHQLAASDGFTGDLFGSAVDISSTTVVVGASGADAAYLFTTSCTAPCSELKKLTAPSTSSFGQAVSIDGGTVAVGAPYTDDGSVDVGQVTLFDAACTPSGGTCSPAHVIPNPIGLSNDAFGRALDLNNDTLVVGANTGTGVVNGGAIFLYDCYQLACNVVTLLAPPDRGNGDYLGRAVATTGTKVYGGAPGRDVGFNTAQGAAYVFDTPVYINREAATGREYYGCGRSGLEGYCYFPTTIRWRVPGETYTYTIVMTQQGEQITHTYQGSWAYLGDGSRDEFAIGVYRNDDLGRVTKGMDLANPQTVEFTIASSDGTCTRSEYVFQRIGRGTTGSISINADSQQGCTGGILEAAAYTP